MNTVDWGTVRLAAMYFGVPADELEQELQVLDAETTRQTSSGCSMRTQGWPYGLCGRTGYHSFGGISVCHQHYDALAGHARWWIAGSRDGRGEATPRDIELIVQALRGRLKRIRERGQWDSFAKASDEGLTEALKEYLNVNMEDATKDALVAVWGES